MTVAELIERLGKWPQDAPVVAADALDNFHVITDTGWWAAYDEGFVVILSDSVPLPQGIPAPEQEG